jgi:hypothetical protein
MMDVVCGQWFSDTSFRIYRGKSSVIKKRHCKIISDDWFTVICQAVNFCDGVLITRFF